MLLVRDTTKAPTVTTPEFGSDLKGYQDSTLRPHQVMIHPALLRALEPIIDGALLFEVGCGDGRIVDLLVREYGDRYRSFTAVDINKVQREAARRFLHARRGSYNQGHVRANILGGDVRSLHFGDDEFDVVVCSMVLMHFPLRDLRRALAETHRVTRPGGRGLFVVTSYDWCRLQYPLEELQSTGEQVRQYCRYTRSHDGRAWNQYTCRALDYEELLGEAGWKNALPREDTRIPFDPLMADRYQRHLGFPLFWLFHVQKH